MMIIESETLQEVLLTIRWSADRSSSPRRLPRLDALIAITIIVNTLNTPLTTSFISTARVEILSSGTKKYVSSS